MVRRYWGAVATGRASEPHGDATGGNIGEMAKRGVAAELVGRADQLESLRAAWADVVGGKPRVTVVTGEAGIGKSRIVSELAAGVQDGEVRRGQCVRLGHAALPLAPFRVALADLLPWSDGGWETGDLVDRVALVLARRTQTLPVLLVIEDLHWADEASLDVVDHIARSLPTSRLMLLVNLRVDPPAPRPVRDLVAEVSRLPHAELLPLTRLDDRDVVRQMQSILGRPPKADVARRVVQRSQGVPFLVEELTAAEAAGVDRLPESVVDIMSLRASSVSPTARSLLEAAAIAGDRMTEARLLELARLDPIHVQPGLRELLDTGLLVIDHDDGTFSFRHALLREAVERELLPSQAADLHRRCAELMSMSADDSDLVTAAHHWWLAGEASRPRALEAAAVAAAAARRMGAFGEELVHRERILSVRDGAEPGTADHEERIRQLGQAAIASERAGELDRAHDLFEVARSELDLGLEPELAAWLLTREAGVLLNARGELPEVEADLRTVTTLLEPAPGPALGVALSGLLQFEQRHRSDRDRLLDLTLAALRHIDGHDDYTEAHLRGYLAVLVGMDPDATEEALDLFDRAVAWAEEHSEPNAAMAIMINRTDYLLALGQSRAAFDAGQQTLRATERRPVGGSMRDYITGNLADAALVTGRWDAGVAALQESFLVDQTNLERSANYSVLGLLHLALGDVGAAGVCAEESRRRRGEVPADPQFVTGFAQLDGELALVHADPEGAVERVREVEHHLVVVWPGWAWPLLDLAARSVAAARGRMPDWLTAAVEAQLRRGPTPLYWPPVLLARLGGSLAGWDAALRATAEPDAPVLVRMQTRLSAAEAIAAAGDRRRAQALLRQVVEEARRLGAAGILGAAGDLAKRARLPLDDAPASRHGGPSQDLTARELDVLRLVAAGRSNAHIASQLVISPKTVSVHISHILDKLTAHSRGEAAAIARERGIV